MTLLLCYSADPVGERQGPGEILEPVLILQVMLVDDRPVALATVVARGGLLISKASGLSAAEIKRGMSRYDCAAAAGPMQIVSSAKRR